MTSENGQKVTKPAQLVYYDNDPMLTISFPDTVERYTIVQRVKHGGATIVQVTSKQYKGYVYIVHQQRERGESTGRVFFYGIYKGKRVERIFSVNPKKCYSLIKKYRKEMKKTPG